MAKCFQSPWELEIEDISPSLYKGSLLLTTPSLSSSPLTDRPSAVNASSSSSSSEKATAALKIHSLAEKKRRERINSHLSALRHIIPNANRMDKASLLAKVVEQVKELRTRAEFVTLEAQAPIPAQSDEIAVVEYREGGAAAEVGVVFLKATVCCDDRPELLGELSRAFSGLNLVAVRAEIVTVGGRARNVFLLKSTAPEMITGDSSRGGGGIFLETVKQVLEGIAAASSSQGKRQRFMQNSKQLNMTI